ncbi:RNA polymerase subunit sigma-70 [Kribbella jiaozuonensis]|uniref:RNA polymerase sigma factor n=1 Tax=Kribbella jiaozuonensis TaxID=2575441 RepID=A0A4V5UWD0_9ACTN|nr:RNA polymerase subunit sigma-70 [Kribbella jiaozuonensis]TKK76363.1 sigma-70 family RNA polymerase sigma factor [Kribbella jiaozuonensis]
MGSDEQFAADTERYRRELLALCYRMVGSAHDAEDLVQETYLRAWRSYAGFEGRASIRSWLYKIATNICLTALDTRRGRMLPSGLAGPHDGPDRPPLPAAPGEVSWLEPLPDSWISSDDPAAVVVARESVRLALIASLQLLPPRQRAVLILREVLAFPATDTAEILGTTTAAVKSALQRARSTLDDVEPDDLLEPTDERARALLDGYITAFERSDANLLKQVLRADATLEATPFRDWQAGKTRCIHLLTTHVFGKPGDWRLIPTTANGQPAAVVHHHGQASGVVVLTATTTGISKVVEFQDSTLVATFSCPRGELRSG